MYRLFIDEVGHHNMRASDDPNERYLGLTGIIMRAEDERGTFTESLNEIKQRVFGRSDFPLHRRDIINKKPAPFDCLRDELRKKDFDESILELVQKTPYRVITVVIDKQEHGRKYKVWQFQPYHYCLTVMLERYVLCLDRASSGGDVMVESRGKKENMQLSRSYKGIFQKGTVNIPARLFQAHLTSGEIKIRKKSDNISGLQFTDLIANPAVRQLVCQHTGVEMTALFGRAIVEVLLAKKWLRSYHNGKIEGYGTKWLP